MIGRLMSSHVGSSRYKSGQSGRYFFLALFCCYVFASVSTASGVCSRFWQVLYDSRRRQTRAGHLAVGEAERRVWTVNVESGRSKSIQVDPGRVVFFFLAFVWLGLRAFARCLCWVMGSSQAWKGPPSPPDSLHSGSHGFMMMKIRSQQCLFTFRHRGFVSLFLMQLPCVNGAMVLVRECASRFGSQDSPRRAPTRCAPTDPRRIGTVRIRCNCPCVWACYVVR